MRDNGNGGPAFALCRDLGEIWDRVKDGLATGKLANVFFRLNQHSKHNLFLSVLWGTAVGTGPTRISQEIVVKLNPCSNRPCSDLSA